MATYKIVRKYYASMRYRTIMRGLTLEQAQAHCKDPESSSKTCKRPLNVMRTKDHGAWFDSYTIEYDKQHTA